MPAPPAKSGSVQGRGVAAPGLLLGVSRSTSNTFSWMPFGRLSKLFMMRSRSGAASKIRASPDLELTTRELGVGYEVGQRQHLGASNSNPSDFNWPHSSMITERHAAIHVGQSESEGEPTCEFTSWLSPP